MEFPRRRFLRALLSAAAVAPVTTALVRAQQKEEEKFDFDIPPQVLASAIPSFMHVTEIKIAFTPELVDKKRTQGVFGSFTIEEGLEVLLDGTGLTYTLDSPKNVTLKADA